MKLYRILAIAAAVTLSSCIKDDTNLDFATLDKPVVSNLSTTQEFKVAYNDELVVIPEIEYKDMNDLRYEWNIDGEIVSTEKDLHWVKTTTADRQYGHFALYRKSAGNADIYRFSITRYMPFESGFPIVAKKGGKTVIHFLKCIISTTAADVELLSDVAPIDVPETLAEGSRIVEYWDNSRTNVIGNLMLVTSDPNYCINLNGSSMDPENTLAQEFIDGNVPAGLQVKNVMPQHGYEGFVQAQDGTMYNAFRGKGYFEGRYLNTPWKFGDQAVKIDCLIPQCNVTSMGASVCLLYDGTNHRFLIKDTQYSTATVPSTAGPTIEMIESDVDEAKQDKMIFCANINMANARDFEHMSYAQYWALFKGTDGNYYARQFWFDFNYHEIGAAENNYPETYIQIDDMNENSVIHVMPTFTTNYAHIYYTDGVDQKVLRVRKRDQDDLGEPAVFKEFDKEIVSVSSACTQYMGFLCICFKDGSVMLYNTQDYTLGASFTEFKEERVTLDSTDPEINADLGEIVSCTYKWGKASAPK